MIEKIVSGGQTGADRAALDWAIARVIPHAGWCPRGRKAEDGPIPSGYRLTETTTANYLQRTEQNVVDSDATVIVTLSSSLSGGSKRTADFCLRHEKPFLHLVATAPGAPEILARFGTDHHVHTLNVAGPRSSNEPAIGSAVYELLSAAFPITQS